MQKTFKKKNEQIHKQVAYLIETYRHKAGMKDLNLRIRE